MTNGSSFVQLGQYLIPTDQIRFINLFEGSNVVRVHLHTAPGAMHTPQYLDFAGEPAIEIRNWASRAGGVDVILEAPETGGAAGR